LKKKIQDEAKEENFLLADGSRFCDLVSFTLNLMMSFKKEFGNRKKNQLFNMKSKLAE